MGLFRTFLALSVFSWHMASEEGHFLLNGAFAVLSFYMISGFLMSLTFSQNYQRRARGTRRFFLNRSLRIYPPYLLVIFLTVVFHYLAGIHDPILGYRGAVRDVSLLAQFGLALSNIVLFGIDVLTYLDKIAIIILPNNGRLLGPSWSMACELLFYIGVPWVTSKSWRLLLGLIALAFALRYMLGDGFPDRHGIDLGRYYLAPATWVFFLLGMLSFRLTDRICSIADSGTRAYLALGAFAVGLVVCGFDRFGSLDSPRAWCYYLSLFAALPLLWKMSKDSVVDDWVGRFSYPIYLVHPLLIDVHAYLFGDNQATVLRYAIVTSCLLLAAGLLYFSVERPIEFVRARVRRRRAVDGDGSRAIDRSGPALSQVTVPIRQMQPAAGSLLGQPTATDS
jgi:peptidoglycan/LPS O-acetylase OafA/YrhL